MDKTLRVYENQSALEYVYLDLILLLEIYHAWVVHKEGNIHVVIEIEKDEENNHPLYNFHIKVADPESRKDLTWMPTTFCGVEYHVPADLHPNCSLVDVLKGLSELICVPIAREIEQAILIAHAYEGKEMYACLFNARQLQALRFLGLGEIINGPKGTIKF
jgi:hypothetical protein